MALRNDPYLTTRVGPLHEAEHKDTCSSLLFSLCFVSYVSSVFDVLHGGNLGHNFRCLLDVSPSVSGHLQADFMGGKDMAH